MYVPIGLSEAQVFDAISKVSKRLAKAYALKGSMYTAEDLEQQCFLWALENLERYTPGKPLENFMQVVLRNKLNNLRRNKLHRSEIPCKACHSGDFCGPEGTPCSRHIEWRTNNKAKADILYPVHLDIVEEEKERGLQQSGDYGDLESQELNDKIAEQLPPKLRPHFLRLVDGAPILPSHRTQIKKALRAIMWADYAKGQTND